MNPIILISTYGRSRERGDNDAVRETYLKYWGHLLPHLFVADRDYPDVRIDEISVDSSPGFMNGAFKTQMGVRWALGAGYDYAFIVPTDCYVVVPRLLASGYEKVDYTGFQVPDEGHIGGGSGYWVSKRVMEALARAEPRVDYEDRWVGNVARGAGIMAVHDPRYWEPGQPWQEGIITAHLGKVTGVYDPNWMIDQHTTFMVEKELCQK